MISHNPHLLCELKKKRKKTTHIDNLHAPEEKEAALPFNNLGSQDIFPLIC